MLTKYWKNKIRSKVYHDIMGAWLAQLISYSTWTYFRLLILFVLCILSSIWPNLGLDRRNVFIVGCISGIVWIYSVYVSLKFEWKTRRKKKCLLKCTLYCHTDNHIINTWSCSSNLLLVHCMYKKNLKTKAHKHCNLFLWYKNILVG